MEASAESAAILAGKPTEPFRIYGRNLGIAFQMIDDLLDVTQTSEQLGKPAMHDLAEGKVTLPYIYLYNSLDTQDQSTLLSLHGKAHTKDEQKWISAQMQKHDIPKICFKEAKSLVDQAVSLMNKIGETKLQEIATAMIERSF